MQRRNGSPTAAELARKMRRDAKALESDASKLRAAASHLAKAPGRPKAAA